MYDFLYIFFDKFCVICRFVYEFLYNLLYLDAWDVPP